MMADSVEAYLLPDPPLDPCSHFIPGNMLQRELATGGLPRSWFRRPVKQIFHESDQPPRGRPGSDGYGILETVFPHV